MSGLDSSGSKDGTDDDTQVVQDGEGSTDPVIDDDKDMFEEEPMSQNLLGGGGLTK